jgi:branched-subunit amino acid aminotransferase/4-amino-4-deoxychorismate lyase
MKAYKSIHDESDLRLFRPELNMKRLRDSMARLAMPGHDFDAQELINCIGKLVRLGESYLILQQDCVRKERALDQIDKIFSSTAHTY